MKRVSKVDKKWVIIFYRVGYGKRKKGKLFSLLSNMCKKSMVTFGTMVSKPPYLLKSGVVFISHPAFLYF